MISRLTLILLMLMPLVGCVRSGSTDSGAAQSGKDAFGVPNEFHASYRLEQDEDISLGSYVTRRNVRITVPAGLSDSDLENNMRIAAEQAYKADARPHAITVFAYKPGTPTDMTYTAGRLQWAPYSDWMKADKDVSLEDHKATMDVSDEYRPKPKSTAPKSASEKKIDADLSKIDDWEKKREAKLNRRVPEARRRRIYYDEQKAMNDGLVNPGVHGDPKASMDANVAVVCRRYHISTDDADCIRTEGDTANWPQPD